MRNSINSHNFLKAAASRIRAVRERLGLNQEIFARQLGISQSSLSLVEAEKRKPSVQLLYSLLIVFNVDLHWILNGQGKMFNQDQGLTVDEPGFEGIFSRIPMETDVIDLIKSLEVPIMRNALLAKYFLYQERYKDIIREYYKNKKKESNFFPPLL